MSVENHDLELMSDFIEGGWTPGCSCGWLGRCQRSEDTHEAVEAATDEWENHCDVVFMEATTEGES